MAAGEKKLSQLTQRTVFPSDSLIYGTSSGTSYAFGLEAMQNLIRYSSSVSNLFTTPLNLTRSGQNITVPADRTWNIFGEEYTNPSSVTRNVPFAATGKTRIDLLVANTSNAFVLVTGTEVDLPAAPSAPPVPFMTLEATFLIVTDDSVSDHGEPTAPIYLGDFDSEASLFGGIPRPYKGYFAWVKNLGGQFVYRYNGADWEIDLIGEKIFEEVGGTSGVYTFVVNDRWKDILLAPAVEEVILTNGIDFPVNSELHFRTFNTPVTLTTTESFLYYLGTTIESITVNPGDLCRLKKVEVTGGGVWELIIVNSFISGKFSLQVTQSGTSAPVIVMDSLKGNFGATITPSYDSAGVYLFTSSLPIFANLKNAFKQEANAPTNLISGTAFFTLGYYTFVAISSTMCRLTVYNDIFSPGTSADNLITEPILLELPYN